MEDCKAGSGCSLVQTLGTLLQILNLGKWFLRVWLFYLQGPLSRFGDTAANAGTLSLLDSYEATKGLNVGIKTLAASFSAGLFRILLMPIDACKTILQARLSYLYMTRFLAVIIPQYPSLHHTSHYGTVPRVAVPGHG